MEERLQRVFRILGLQASRCTPWSTDKLDNELSRYADTGIDVVVLKRLIASRDFVLKNYSFQQTTISPPIKPYSKLYSASGETTVIRSDSEGLSLDFANHNSPPSYSSNTESKIRQVFWKGWQFDGDDNIVYSSTNDDGEEYIVKYAKDDKTYFDTIMWILPDLLDRLAIIAQYFDETLRAEPSSKNGRMANRLFREYYDQESELSDQLKMMARGEGYTSPARLCEELAESLVTLAKLAVISRQSPEEDLKIDLNRLFGDLQVFRRDPYAQERDNCDWAMWEWLIDPTILGDDPDHLVYMKPRLNKWVNAIKWKWEAEAKKWSATSLWKETERKVDGKDT